MTTKNAGQSAALRSYPAVGCLGANGDRTTCVGPGRPPQAPQVEAALARGDFLDQQMPSARAAPEKPTFQY